MEIDGEENMRTISHHYFGDSNDSISINVIEVFNNTILIHCLVSVNCIYIKKKHLLLLTAVIFNLIIHRV